MSNRYPPSMTMREFDRATADQTETCQHGEWAPDCHQCREDAQAEAADRKRDEMADREFDPDCL